MITYDCDYGTTTGSSIWTPYGSCGTYEIPSYCANNSSTTLTVEYGYNNEGTSSSSDWCAKIKYVDTATTTGNYWKKVVKVIQYPTGRISNSFTVWDSCCSEPRRSATDRLKEIIRNRQAPAFHRSRNHLDLPSDIREIRARETLRRVLGDQKFRSFLKNGFVSVKAKSSLVYQIFPGHGITKVFKDGQLTERLCVVLKGHFPPTDSLIMRYLLILNDENDFRKHAISHSIAKSATPKEIDQRPLTEIFKELKVA